MKWVDMFGRARTRLCLTPLRSRIRKHNRLAYSLHSNPAKNEWLWSLVVRPGPVTSSHHKHHTDTTDSSTSVQPSLASVTRTRTSLGLVRPDPGERRESCVVVEVCRSWSS